LPNPGRAGLSARSGRSAAYPVRDLMTNPLTFGGLSQKSGRLIEG
jgi:hypothetical protein